MDYKKELSQNLSFLMNDKEINNYLLGKTLGIASSSIAQWLNFKYFPSLTNLIKLTNYFHTSIDFLFSLSDKQYFFPSYNINFFETLEENLKANSVSRQKLCAKCQFDYAQFNKWSKGSYPQTETLINIAVYLELPIEYIIGRTDKTVL